MEKFEYEEAMSKFVAWITEKKHGNVFGREFTNREETYC